MGEREDWYKELIRETKNAPNPAVQQYDEVMSLFLLLGVLFVIMIIGSILYQVM